MTIELQPNEMHSELKDITAQLTQHFSEHGVLRFLSQSDDNAVLDQQASNQKLVLSCPITLLCISIIRGEVMSWKSVPNL